MPHVLLSVHARLLFVFRHPFFCNVCPYLPSVLHVFRHPPELVRVRSMQPVRDRQGEVFFGHEDNLS